MRFFTFIAALLLVVPACGSEPAPKAGAHGPKQGKKGGKGKGKGKGSKAPADGVIQSAAVEGRRTGIPKLDKALLNGYERRFAGQYPDWTASAATPETPAGVWGAVTPLFDTCAWDQLDPLGLDCTENPCLVIFGDRSADGIAAVEGCDAAGAAFPDGLDVDGFSKTCPDGHIERWLLLSRTPSVEGDEADRIDAARASRASAIEAGWQCDTAKGTAPTTPPG